MPNKSELFIVAYNHDYNEYSNAFRDPRLAVIDLAIELGITSELSEAGATEEFWEAVAMEYSENSWKGLTVHKLDTVGLNMERMGPKALEFTLAELAEVDSDFEVSSPAP